MPFYPSPSRDDGYDITDFYAVDPRLGTLGDLVELVRTARDRGIRVIADLVVNHTSDQHPWFQAARSDRDSPYRDFYVWADEKPEEKPGDVVFPDQENSNWAWDERGRPVLPAPLLLPPARPQRGQPAVRDEIAQVMGFWLEQGLSGFRVDAVPVPARADRACPRARSSTRTSSCATCAPTSAAATARRCCSARSTSRRRPARSSSATRTATSCTCSSTSSACRRMYLALARGDAGAAARGAARGAGRSRPTASGRASCATTTSSRSTSSPTTSARRSSPRFGPDETLQLYGRGLRRRLPPMLDGDERRDPDGLLPGLLAARHAGAVLRRGDRHGREPRRSRAASACARRCSGQTSATAGSRPRRRRGGCAARWSTRALRARARSTSPPAPRPGLAAELVRAAHPAPARVPRARLRHARGCSTPARRRCSPTAATGRARRSSPSTSWRRGATRVELRGRTTARRSSTSSRTTSTRCRAARARARAPRHAGSACAATAGGCRPSRAAGSACALSTTAACLAGRRCRRYLARTPNDQACGHQHPSRRTRLAVQPREQ